MQSPRNSIKSISNRSQTDLNTHLHPVSPTKRSRVEDMKEKFDQLQQKIDPQHEVQNDKMFFNLFKWETDKNTKLNNDPQIIAAKIKHIENEVELKKADHLLEERHSPRKRYHSVTKTIDKNNNKPIKNYLQQYESMSRDILAVKPHEETEDEQQDAIEPIPELAKRPKILKYIMNKITQSRVTTLAHEQRILEDTNNKQFVKHLKKEFDDTMKLIKQEEVQNSAERIINRQYPKFFNKNNDSYMPDQIKQKQICKQMIRKQQSISMRSPDIGIENRRRLQEKFNHIVKEIAKTQRYNKREVSSLLKLPRIRN